MSRQRFICLHSQSRLIAHQTLKYTIHTSSNNKPIVITLTTKLKTNQKIKFYIFSQSFSQSKWSEQRVGWNFEKIRNTMVYDIQKRQELLERVAIAKLASQIFQINCCMPGEIL